MWFFFATGMAIFLNVILRFWNISYLGIFQISEFVLSICVFTTLAYGWYSGAHVRVDALLNKFPRRLKGSVEIVDNVLGVFLFGAIAVWNISMALFTYQIKETTWVSQIPTFPVYIIISLGSLLMICQMVLAIFNNIFNMRGTEE
jgi:TRAP-type C4-dicarboxylate transport system permease small subunit